MEKTVRTATPATNSDCAAFGVAIGHGRQGVLNHLGARAASERCPTPSHTTSPTLGGCGSSGSSPRPAALAFRGSVPIYELRGPRPWPRSDGTCVGSTPAALGPSCFFGSLTRAAAGIGALRPDRARSSLPRPLSETLGAVRSGRPFELSVPNGKREEDWCCSGPFNPVGCHPRTARNSPWSGLERPNPAILA